MKQYANGNKVSVIPAVVLKKMMRIYFTRMNHEIMDTSPFFSIPLLPVGLCRYISQSCFAFLPLCILVDRFPKEFIPWIVHHNVVVVINSSTFWAAICDGQNGQ